jgi:hypothetical protein
MFAENELSEKNRKKSLTKRLHNGFFISFALILITIMTGCDNFSAVGGASVLTVQMINTENCTALEVKDANGQHITDIRVGGAAEKEILHSRFENRDKATLVASTVGEVPEGCDDWGTDDETFRLDEDDDTETWKIRLRN